MSWFPLEHCSLPQSSKFWPNYVPPECCRGVPRPIWIIRDTQRTSKVHSCWRQRPENNVKVVQLCLDFLLKSWSRPTNGQFGPNWMPPGCCMGAPWPLWVIRNTQRPCKSIVVEDKGQTKVKGHPTRSWFAWSDDDPNHIISRHWVPPECYMGVTWRLRIMREPQRPCRFIAVQNKGQRTSWSSTGSLS